MTPQEKAQQLVAKMKGFTVIDCKYNALIAVDEIIQNNKSFLRTNNELHNDGGLDADLEYWQRVKQEIEKL
jgi:hypothetical protein